jgi:transcription elongation factor GreA
LAVLEDGISRSEVIDVSGLSGDTVKFGATVSLIDEDTDEKLTFQLVGELEADVKDGRMAINAPLARALIGKMVGESVEVITPNGEKIYEILKIKFV